MTLGYDIDGFENWLKKQQLLGDNIVEYISLKKIFVYS